MNKFQIVKWFLYLLRVGLGVIFIYAGYTKLIDPQSFADSIESFKILPHQFIGIVALGLPVLEMASGISVVIGYKVRTGLLSILLMTFIFTLALLSALARGIVVDCGCFGGGAPSAFKNLISLGRDILILCAAAYLYMRSLSDGTKLPQ